MPMMREVVITMAYTSFKGWMHIELRLNKLLYQTKYLSAEQTWMYGWMDGRMDGWMDQNLSDNEVRYIFAQDGTYI